LDKYAIDHWLARLMQEGETLREKGSEEEKKIWLATASGTLAFFLPKDSPIVNALNEIRDAESQTGPEAIQLGRAVQLLQVAAEFNRMRRDDQTVATLREDLRSVMGETFLKSPWFYIGIVILTAAFGLAVLGVIQIKGYKIDAEQEVINAQSRINRQLESVQKTIGEIGERATKSADAARQVVETKLDSQLATYVTTTKGRIGKKAEEYLGSLKDTKTNAEQRIDKEAVKYLENLKRTKTPELESSLITLNQSRADLQNRIEKLQQDTLFLKGRVDELTEGLKRLHVAAKASPFERLSIFLNRSRYFVLLEVVITGLALLFSIIVLGAILLQRRRVTRG